MKKTIIGWAALLTLASCGTASIDTPQDALRENQIALIEKMEASDYLSISSWNSVWTIDFDITAQEWKTSWGINYDTDFEEYGTNSSSSIQVKLNVEAEESPLPGLEKIAWGIDFSLISLKDKILFKLDSLSIDEIEKNPQLAIFTWMVAPFQNKWFFIENPSQPQLDIQKNIFKNYKQFMTIIKDNTVLELVKENENSNFYDYDVKLSNEVISKIIKETTILWEWKETDLVESTDTEINAIDLPKTELTEDDIQKMINDINESVTMNMKMNKSNLENFVLTITHEDWTGIIENTETNFNITFESTKENTIWTFVWIKSPKWLVWDILIKSEEKEILTWKLNIELWEETSNVSIEWQSTTDWETLEFKLNLSDKTIEKAVEIVEPEETVNFEEMLGSMMGWLMWGASFWANELNEEDTLENTIEIWEMSEERKEELEAFMNVELEEMNEEWINSIESFVEDESKKKIALTNWEAIIKLLRIKNEIYLIWENSISGPIIEGSEIKKHVFDSLWDDTFIDATDLHSDIVLITEKWKTVVFSSNWEFKFYSIIGEEIWVKSSTITSYASNIFLIDKENHQIYKYQKAWDNFNKWVTFIKKEDQESFDNIQDIAIDGWFYILQKDLSIKKLFTSPSYRLQNIAISNLPENYNLENTETSIKIKTRLDLDYVYMLLNNKIYVFKPNSTRYQDTKYLTYVWQVEGSTSNIIDFYIKKDWELMILNESWVYEMIFEISEGKLLLK